MAKNRIRVRISSKATINGGWSTWERAEFNAGQGFGNAIWLNTMSLEGSYPYFVTEFPKNYLSLETEDNDTVETIETDISAYVLKARAPFISGEDDIDTMWDTYVNIIKDIGIDTVESIYQKYYDDFVASMFMLQQ